MLELDFLVGDVAIHLCHLSTGAAEALDIVEAIGSSPLPKIDQVLSLYPMDCYAANA